MIAGTVKSGVPGLSVLLQPPPALLGEPRSALILAREVISSVESKPVT